MAAQATPKKPLLLIDLNGTVIFRTEEQIPGAKYTAAFRGKFYYARPDIISFLREMSKHYVVGIYSSVMRHNITTFLMAMDPNWKSYITYIYDRDFTKPDPNGENKWDTIRDMDKIWTISRHSELDTVLLDNEPRKVQEVVDNAIIVPEFGRAQVLNRSCLLGDLQEYLVRLSESNPDDVRSYMKTKPWRDGWRVDEATTQLEILQISAVPFEITMSFDRCENGILYYKGASGNDNFVVKLQNSKGVYPARIQLARLLEMGMGEHLLYKNDRACPYLMSDCLAFLSKTDQQ